MVNHCSSFSEGLIYIPAIRTRGPTHFVQHQAILERLRVVLTCNVWISTVSKRAAVVFWRIDAIRLLECAQTGCRQIQEIDHRLSDDSTITGVGCVILLYTGAVRITNPLREVGNGGRPH